MLNPLMRVGAVIGETLFGGEATPVRLARPSFVDGWRKSRSRGRTCSSRLPFQLSGGMCQRVALAAALARDPELLIADEPSTALDATTQAEIMGYCTGSRCERGMGMILITHDLRLAFSACRAGVRALRGLARWRSATRGHGERSPASLHAGLLLAEPPRGSSGVGDWSRSGDRCPAPTT